MNGDVYESPVLTFFFFKKAVFNSESFLPGGKNSPEVQPLISNVSFRWMEACCSPTSESSLASRAVKEHFCTSLTLLSLITNSSLLRYVHVSCIIIRLHLQTRTGLRRGLWSTTPRTNNQANSKEPHKYSNWKCIFFFLFLGLFPSI